MRQGWRGRFRVTQASLVWILQFPKILPGSSFPGNGKFFRDQGKSSPVNIPSYNFHIIITLKPASVVVFISSKSQSISAVDDNCRCEEEEEESVCIDQGPLAGSSSPL